MFVPWVNCPARDRVTLQMGESPVCLKEVEESEKAKWLIKKNSCYLWQQPGILRDSQLAKEPKLSPSSEETTASYYCPQMELWGKEGLEGRLEDKTVIGMGKGREGESNGNTTSSKHSLVA